MNEFNYSQTRPHCDRISKRPSAPGNWPTIMERAVEGAEGRANTRIRGSGCTYLHCQSIAFLLPFFYCALFVPL